MSSRNQVTPSIDLFVCRYHQHWRERGYSAYAWPAQESHLRLFAAFLLGQNITDAASVTHLTLAVFRRWLFENPSKRARPRAATTINRVLGTVRALFKYLRKEGLIQDDPADRIEYMHEPDRLPREILSPTEAALIIETPNTRTLLGYRDRTILEVLYATGVRKRELLNLRVSDVNIEDQLLRINGGKGGRDRVVPLTGIACSYLQNYVSEIRLRLLRSNPHTALFISLEASPLGRTTLDDLVGKYARLAGVGKRVTPHVWRHTCATHLVRNRASLRHVQEMLGHRALTTTERYLHLTITDLKDAHRRFHPRERGSKR